MSQKKRRQIGNGESAGMVVPPEVAAKLDGKPRWQPHPGFQEECLLTDAFEILLSGVKGSGKSAVSRAFIIKGNPHRPLYDLRGNFIHPNLSYVKHPRYTSLVLRKNQQDLRDWIEHSKELYLPLGAQYLTNPITIKWPDGGVTYTGHLADESSWGKYLGVEIHRLVIEEIVLIEKQEVYEKLRSCVRSSIPIIRPQIMATCNPFGPGVGWIREWWTQDSLGKEILPGEKQEIITLDRDTGKQFKTSRIWYFGRWGDNPVQHTDEYKAQMLAGKAQHLIKAYVYGEWDAASGSYLPHFRPNGPLDGEPAEARHVLPAVETKPWDRIVIGADWGMRHNAAAVRLKSEMDGRVRAERSFSEAGLSTYSFGELIAGLVKDDLKHLDQPVRVYLSPDCWSRESEVESEAKRIAKGMARVVGPERLVLDDEELLDGEKLDAPGRIVLRKANNARIEGWTLLSELMLWRKDERDLEPKSFTLEEADHIWRTQGDAAWKRYRKAWLAAMPKPRPAFIISDLECNQKLIRALQKMQHGPKGDGDIDKKHWEGADIVDALRYGLLSSKLDRVEPSDQLLLRMRLHDMEKTQVQSEEQFMENWMFSMRAAAQMTQKSSSNQWADRLAGVGRRRRF